MPKHEKAEKLNITSVGGQAVLEGVMMQGKTSYCTAVRDASGEIQVERIRIKRSKGVATAAKIPFVRGTVNLFSSLVRGMKTLRRSAKVYGEDEEEPGKLQSMFAEKFKLNLTDVVTVIASILGIVLAIAIFMLLPNFLTGLLTSHFPVLKGSVWEYVILGVIKLAIFLTYMALILIFKDVKRLYRYHGAEHKTINCYEKGLPLTPENVKSCSRIHDRCGTSFMFIVILINVVIVSLVNWGLGIQRIENGFLVFLAKIGVEIVLLPVIAGISYELLRFLAKFHGPISKIFKSPGALIQKVFTTREPDLEMIEVAIAAFNSAMEMDENPEMEESEFITEELLSKLIAQTKAEFEEREIDESDAEWIYSIVLGIKRSELEKERTVKPSEAKKIKEIVTERLSGKPLWYIIGDVDFYGCKIKVDERALIPRPETEILAESVVRTAEDGDKILDLCTGSGCIAVSVAKNGASKKLSVTAADVSEAALLLAKENANYNSVDITFVESDLLSKVHGRFNIIVCNPPYVPTAEIAVLQKEVRDYEPRVALDGGEDGLEFYRRLAKVVSRYLTRGGMLMLECGEGQAEEIIKLFDKRDYAMVMKDYAGVDRFLKIAF